MRTIRIRVVIDMGIGIIRGVVVRVVTLVVAGLVVAAIVPVTRMAVVLTIPAATLASQVVEQAGMLARLVIIRRGVA